MYIYIGIVLYLPSLSYFYPWLDFILLWNATCTLYYWILFSSCEKLPSDSFFKLAKIHCEINLFDTVPTKRIVTSCFFHADKIIFNHQENLILCNILRRQTLEQNSCKSWPRREHTGTLLSHEISKANTVNLQPGIMNHRKK